jgi:RNA polymerase sigma-70 factor (ECF subfamily)
MVRDRAAAEDITQEVFTDAIGALATFRGDSSPRTWLLSIARNRCIDYLRARRREPWDALIEDGSQSPDAQAEQCAFDGEWLTDRVGLLRALDDLAEGDRALIVLRFKNGLEYDELATAFGLREGTVRMRVSRALARMRKVLGIGALLHRELAGTAPAAAAAQRIRAVPASAPSPPPAFVGSARFGSAGPRPAPLASRPIGALGIALSDCEPGTPSGALFGRLSALVAKLPA